MTTPLLHDPDELLRLLAQPGRQIVHNVATVTVHAIVRHRVEKARFRRRVLEGLRKRGLIDGDLRPTDAGIERLGPAAPVDDRAGRAAALNDALDRFAR